MEFLSVLVALFSFLTITTCYESDDSDDSCGTYVEDRCMTDCVGAIPNMIFQLNNVCLQMNTTNETSIEEKYFNVISECIDYCNVTLALSSHSNGGRSLISYILQSNFGLLGGQVNMVAAQEATYYITGHSKKKCKRAINWEMDLSASGECENTGSPGGDSAKIWNNGGAQFLQLDTWEHHDCRKGRVGHYAIPNNGRGVCSEDGVIIRSYGDEIIQ